MRRGALCCAVLIRASNSGALALWQPFGGAGWRGTGAAGPSAGYTTPLALAAQLPPSACPPERLHPAHVPAFLSFPMPPQLPDEVSVAPLTMGRIASSYYLRHATMRVFAEQLRPRMDVQVRTGLRIVRRCVGTSGWAPLLGILVLYEDEWLRDRRVNASAAQRPAPCQPGADADADAALSRLVLLPPFSHAPGRRCWARYALLPSMTSSL